MLLHTPTAEIGWHASSFNLFDPVNSKQVSFEAIQGRSGTLVAFICNHCPYVVAIIARLVKDVKVLQSKGFGVVAINSNDYHYVVEDSPERMIEFSKQHHFSFPYVVDQDQSVAQAYGAVCTPDFFGLDATGVLQYRGRLDDARMDSVEKRTPELLNAMMEIKQFGKGPAHQLSSMGCSIKWKS